MDREAAWNTLPVSPKEAGVALPGTPVLRPIPEWCPTALSQGASQPSPFGESCLCPVPTRGDRVREPARDQKRPRGDDRFPLPPTTVCMVTGIGQVWFSERPTQSFVVFW